MLYFKAGDEIVDLTCESLEPVVVDLTHNDSVVVSVGAEQVSPSGRGPLASTSFSRPWSQVMVVPKKLRHSVTRAQDRKCFWKILRCGFVACGQICVPLAFPQVARKPSGESPESALFCTLHQPCDLGPAPTLIPLRGEMPSVPAGCWEG